MTKLLALFVGVLLAVGASVADADAGDAATVNAVKAALAALDDAFARQDGGAIKRMITAHHIAITSYLLRGTEIGGGTDRVAVRS